MADLNVNSIGDASGGTTTTVNGYTPTVSNMAGRNRIINGDMRIDQRNAGASVTNIAGNVYTIDRWECFGTVASKFTVQQNAGSVTPPADYTNYLGVTSSSAYAITSGDVFRVTHKIEGYNVSDLNWGGASAKSATMSFWVRSSLTGTFGGAITNSSQDRSYPFTYTINSANTWEQKTIPIPGDTSGAWLKNTGIGIFIIFSLGSGSVYSAPANSWTSTSYINSATGAASLVSTNGATFYITGVQLEAGSVATPFEHRQYGQELALCQRYFVRINGRADGYVRHDGNFNCFITLPNNMRTEQPSGTFSNLGAFSNFQSAVASSPSGFSIGSESKAATRGFIFIGGTLGSYSSHTYIPSWEGFSFDASSEL